MQLHPVLNFKRGRIILPECIVPNLSQYLRRLRIKRATSTTLTLIASGTFQRNRWRTDACFQVWSWRYFLLFSIAISRGELLPPGKFRTKMVASVAYLSNLVFVYLCNCHNNCRCRWQRGHSIGAARNRWPVGSKPQAPPTIKPLLLVLQCHHRPYHYHHHHHHHHHGWIDNL